MTVSDRPYWVREPQQPVRDRLAQIASIVDAHEEKLTVRAITYKLYGEDIHGKELDRKYNTTCKDVVRARVLGYVDWSDISEERVQRGGSSGWESKERYLDHHLDVDRLVDKFRLDRTPAHDRPIRVWFEKSTVLNYFQDVCWEFGVKYTCIRGQLNWTTKKESADELDPDTVILYFGDNDSKGHEIRDVIDRDLRFLASELGAAPPEIIWAGVTDDHEARFDLPLYARLDGLDPADLKQLVSEAIREYVDVGELETIVAAEAEQREAIRGRLEDLFDEEGSA